MDRIQKIKRVAERYGQRSITRQQSTTRSIFDTLELKSGQLHYSFFNGVNSRTFPLTNLSDNKLEAGETLAVEFLYVNLISEKEQEGKKSVEILPPTSEILLGTLSIEVMNSIIVKPIRLLSMSPSYNRLPNPSSYVLRLLTIPVIMPLVPFVFNVILPAVPSIKENEKLYMQLTVEGLGSILSPKGTV